MAVTFGAVSARSTGGTTTTSPSYPAAVKAGSIALALRVLKPNTAANDTETGWTRFANNIGGAVGEAQLGDQGATVNTVDFRRLDGSESGSVTFDQSSTPNSAHAVIIIYKHDGGILQAQDILVGDDTSHGTARSHTSTATTNLLVGDVVVALCASDTDTSTAYTSPAITATGYTFGATTERLGAGGVTTGNQTGSMIYEATVASGSGAANLVLTLSSGPSSCGLCTFIVLRQITYGLGNKTTRRTMNAVKRAATW